MSTKLKKCKDLGIDPKYYPNVIDHLLEIIHTYDCYAADQRASMSQQDQSIAEKARSLKQWFNDSNNLQNSCKKDLSFDSE